MVMTGDTYPKKQTANTVILDFGSAKKDDIDDLRDGEGRLFKKAEKVMDDLQEAGHVSDNVQPIIVIIKKKVEKGW